MAASRLAKILSAVFYGVSSILVIYFNKIVLTTYRFPSYLMLAVGQMIATIIVLFVGSKLKIVTIPSMQRDIPKRIFPLPILFLANLVTGLGGTQKLNLPMFTVLRRFSIVMTMILEFVLLGVRASLAVKVSVALMVAGAIIAALNDLTFDAIGYTLILLNDICTASQGVFMKQKLDAKDLGQYGLMYYNSLLMLPLALALAVYTGDFADALNYDNWTNGVFFSLFVLSCVCGFILNYSIVLCTHNNSALTTACIGPIKNLFVTYSGMLLMGDYIFSVINFIGINVSVVGSILYTYVTFRQKPSGSKVAAVTNAGDSKQKAITVHAQQAPAGYSPVGNSIANTQI